MKKIVSIFIIAVFFCGFGCKKDTGIVKDYRVKYAGSYDLFYHSFCWRQEEGIIHSDSGTYVGNIRCDENSNNKIVIDFTVGKKLKYFINEMGELSNSNHRVGEINDEMEINIYESSGGLGGGTRTIIRGKKRIEND